jgi:hypothetical protein
MEWFTKTRTYTAGWPTGWRRAVPWAAAVAVGLVCGFALTFTLLVSAPQMLPSGWSGLLIFVLLALVTCAVSRALLNLHGRELCGGWGALAIAAPIAAVLLFLISARTQTLQWMYGAGPERDQQVHVFRGEAWGATPSAFELHACEAQDGPDTRWPWRASADLSQLRRGQTYQFELDLAQPENSVFDHETRAELPRGDGVDACLFAVQGSAKTSPVELSLNPRGNSLQRHWFPLTVTIPPQAEQLVLEVRCGPAGSSNEFDRLWVCSGEIWPTLLGISGPAAALALRILVACWLAWVLTSLVQAVDGVLSGGRTGPAISRTGLVVRRTARRYWLALVAAGAVILLYYSAIRADFGKLDDYAFLWASKTDPFINIKHDLALGRFLAAPLHACVFGCVNTVSQIGRVRAVSVAGLALLAAGFMALLRHRGWPPLVAAALAVLICATPSAQSTVGLATSVHRPFAALGALLASVAVLHAAGSDSIRRALRWLAAATAALLAAFFFQQSWAMFYVPCCLVTLFRADREHVEPRRWRLLAMQGATLFAALALAAVALRLVGRSMKRTSLMSDASGKLGWFLKEPLINAGSLFHITPSYATVALVGMLILMGGVAFLWRGRVFAAVCLLWGLALLPVAYLPNLLSAENWASFRSIGPLTALILVLLSWAVLGIARLGFRSPNVVASTLFVAAACWLGVTARANMLNNIVSEQIAERELFRSQLLKAEGQDVTAAHVIRPDYKYWPGPVHRYDDFGVPSSYPRFCPEPMFRLISRELPAPLAQKLADVPVTRSLEPIEPDEPGLLQVDMRLLKNLDAEAAHAGGEPYAHSGDE